MSDSILLLTLQVTAIHAAILVAIGYCKASPKLAASYVFAAGICFVVLYILEGMGQTHIDADFRVDISPWPWRLVIHPAVQSVPGLFMIYCHLVFQDDRPIPRVLLALVSFQVLLEGVVLLPEGGIALNVPDLLRVFLDFMQFSFIGLALFWTLKGWNDDLVQDRRLFRWALVSIQGFAILTVLVFENLLVGAGLLDTAQAQILLLSAITLLLTLSLLVLTKIPVVGLHQFEPQTAVSDDTIRKHRSTEMDMADFCAQFEAHKMHRIKGLTISKLARRLNVPEYKLRKFIRETLGFKNFKVMLNQYRVKDACGMLADPANANMSVLKVAQSVGYQSSTPFNIAFREVVGETPSEFRLQSLSR